MFRLLTRLTSCFLIFWLFVLDTNYIIISTFKIRIWRYLLFERKNCQIEGISWISNGCWWFIKWDSARNRAFSLISRVLRDPNNHLFTSFFTLLSTILRYHDIFRTISRPHMLFTYINSTQFNLESCNPSYTFK